MSAQFCRIGKVKVDLKHFLGFDELEKKCQNFMEEAKNVGKMDTPLSAALYQEAQKIKQLIMNSKQCNVTF